MRVKYCREKDEKATDILKLGTLMSMRTVYWNGEVPANIMKEIIETGASIRDKRKKAKMAN